MNERIAMLGPLQQTLVGATDDAVNVQPFLDILPYMNIPDICYSTIIQSGIDMIEIPVFPDNAEIEMPRNVTPTLQGVNKRTKIIPVDDLVFFSFVVIKAFEDYFPSDSYEKGEGGAFARFQLFLVELILAARRNRNIVSVQKIPDVKSLESALPADLYIIFSNLFATFQSHSLNVPASGIEINANNIDFVDDIIIGKAYDKYKKAHGALEVYAAQPERAISIIEKSGNILVERYPSFLTMKKSIIKILPITSKLIDTIFGKLPGTIAEISTKVLSQWMNDKRQLVIYEFPDLLDTILKKRLEDYTRCKGNNTSKC